jgi:hypothetical protein
MLDEEGNPTSPVINYIGRPQSDDGESEYPRIRFVISLFSATAC